MEEKKAHRQIPQRHNSRHIFNGSLNIKSLINFIWVLKVEKSNENFVFTVPIQM
jgi:hypothetical protein